MKSSLFILGSTRSGTSALRNAIAETRYKGAGEGHTIGLLGMLSDTVDTYFRDHQPALGQGTMLAEWQRGDFWNDLVTDYLKQIDRVFPGDHYLDKTPTIAPIQYLDVIQSNVPGPLFIFCRRRGIDNVRSKVRKWPETSFVTHCEEWRDVLNLWDACKPHLTRPWVEVEYLDLVTKQSDVAERLSSFLEFTEEERSLVEQHLHQTRPLTAPDAVAFDETDWSDENKRTFLEICGATMERCGYGYHDYWKVSL